jgi:DNA-binding MarR family transcriptional regulator
LHASDARLRGADPSPGQRIVEFAWLEFWHLDRAPGTKLRRIDLAERLGLTASGVTRTLLPLEKLHLVLRQPDPRDARVGYAVLTESGQQLLNYALISIAPISQEATQAMSAEETAAFSAMLGQLAGIHLANG